MTFSELRYRRLFETAQDGILIVDADSGEITDVNPFLLDMLGYSKQDLIGKKLWEIGFFTDTKASRQAFQKLQDKGYIRYEDLPLKTKDGEPRQVEFVSNLYNVDGERVIQCNVRDITERKKTERLRDEFMGVISHELKAPLTIIIGSLLTASDERLPMEQSKELIGEAVMAAENMGNLMDNLLELARQQSGRLIIKTSPVNVGKVIRNVMNKLQGRSPIHNLIEGIPSGLPEGLADSIRVERILYNLVDNAIKYSPKGGEVRVSARRDGDFLVVSVIDQGEGISRDDLAHLFQSFERLENSTDSNINGTGLGLRTCRILVEAMGGKIWVESEKGKGSTFFFSLPVVRQC